MTTKVKDMTREEIINIVEPIVATLSESERMYFILPNCTSREYAEAYTDDVANGRFPEWYEAEDVVEDVTKEVENARGMAEAMSL